MLPQGTHRFPVILALAYFPILGWSAIHPFDYPTWFLEVFPALAGGLILAFTYRRFPFTHLVYLCIFLHAIILTVGGHYTYARVPWFGDLSQWLGWSRNHYDRLGHFAQGFVPALIAREILLRKEVVVKKAWLFFLVICICLAISAFYELIEWWTALVSRDAAESFLGTQGDVWDTQWDMFMALVGAHVAQVFFAKLQDRQIKKLKAS